jgi:hypothetical protein
MSNAYAAVSALLFAILAVMHLVRIIGRWSVVIGPNNISMNVSWVALVVSALLSIWGFIGLKVGMVGTVKFEGRIRELASCPIWQC